MEGEGRDEVQMVTYPGGENNQEGDQGPPAPHEPLPVFLEGLLSSPLLSSSPRWIHSLPRTRKFFLKSLDMQKLFYK